MKTCVCELDGVAQLHDLRDIARLDPTVAGDAIWTLATMLALELGDNHPESFVAGVVHQLLGRAGRRAA
jgi:hypothetical protein